MGIVWDNNAVVPFWGNIEQFQALSALAMRCVQVVAKSDNPREIVLETWLVLDYAVRDFLLSGYDLHRFCAEDFDLRYMLLPRGFEELLRLLEETISFQVKLSKEPDPQDDYPQISPPIRTSFPFMKYLRDHDEDLFDRLVEVQREYLAEHYPELAVRESAGYIFLPKRKTQQMPDGWVVTASNLGDGWFRRARSLNKARNKAAHSYDETAVAEAFGVRGPQRVSLVRTKCLGLLNELLGILPEIPNES